MNELKSFELNKIYHITLDTVYFGDNAYQLDYKNFNMNDLICIHLIDREENIKSNLIIPFSNLINKNFYYIKKTDAGNKRYYFRYNNVEKNFVKEWEK